MVRAKRSASAMPSSVDRRRSEDRDEGRRQAGLDEHVEQQLGQQEGGVVGVELRAGAERAGEHALAQQADDVAAEEQRRDDERAGRQVPARELGQSPLHRRGTALITLLGASEALGEGVQDAVADRWELVHQRVELAVTDDEQLDDPLGADGRGARHALDQRDLAEEVARARASRMRRVPSRTITRPSSTMKNS